MSMTPAEIRHTPLSRGLLGYRRDQVDDLIDAVVDAYTEVWQDRVDLRERADEMEAEVRRVREMEDLLRRTLVSAEKHAADQKEAARQEAAQIVREAEQQAREIVAQAHTERAAIWRDAQSVAQRGRELHMRYRAFLDTAEAVLGELDVAADADERTEERELLREEITLH
jgi:cell division initiation protein